MYDAVRTCHRQHLFRVRRFTFPLLVYLLHRILVSLYLTFAYKHPAPGLVKGIESRHQRPLSTSISLFSRDTHLSQPTDDCSSQRAVSRLSVRATRTFPLSRFQLIALDCAARHYHFELSMLAGSPISNRPSSTSSQRVLVSGNAASDPPFPFNLPFSILTCSA